MVGQMDLIHLIGVEQKQEKMIGQDGIVVG